MIPGDTDLGRSWHSGTKLRVGQSLHIRPLRILDASRQCILRPSSPSSGQIYGETLGPSQAESDPPQVIPVSTAPRTDFDVVLNLPDTEISKFYDLRVTSRTRRQSITHTHTQTHTQVNVRITSTYPSMERASWYRPFFSRRSILIIMNVKRVNEGGVIFRRQRRTRCCPSTSA